MNKKLIINITRYIFIFLFVYTATSKWIGYRTFVSNIEHSESIAQFAVPLAILIPAAEFIIAALLLFPRTIRLGLWASFVLMGIFTVYVALILGFAPSLPCSCGGIISELSWPQHLVLNIVLTALAAWAVYLSRKPTDDPSTDLFITT